MWTKMRPAEYANWSRLFTYTVSRSPERVFTEENGYPTTICIGTNWVLRYPSSLMLVVRMLSSYTPTA